MLMTAATIAQTQETSLWNRVARVGNLLNQGVEGMVAGTLSLPALVLDGYVNIYRVGREAVGGRSFEASNLYAESKQALTDTGRKLDGSHGKVIGAQDATEAKIVFGAELATGLLGPGAIKSLKTLTEGKAVLAATTSAKSTATTAATIENTAASAGATKTAAGTIEWAAPELSKEASQFAAQTAAKRAAREAGEATASVASVTKTAAAAQAEMSGLRIATILVKEQTLSGRIASLSGHGPKAEAMIERLVSRAKGTGVSADDWLKIKNNTSLPPDLIEKVGKIYENGTRLTSPWHRAVGTVSHTASYPGETLLRVGASPVTVPLSWTWAAARSNPRTALLLGGSAAAYYGADALAGDGKAAPQADKPAADKPAPASSSAREVPLAETVARQATDTAITISRMTATSALALALTAASKIPGLGTTALNMARGSAQSLITEMADGEPDMDRAWEKAQEKIGKILPAKHVATLGEFIKGKGVEDMSAEARTMVSDALEAVTQPTGAKARALRATVVAEAKQKAEDAARLAGPAAGAAGAVVAAVGDDDDPETGIAKGMLAQMMGIDPKSLNAANIARVTKDLVQDSGVSPEVAGGATALGVLAGMGTKGGKFQKSIVGLMVTAVMMFLLPMLGQMFGPLMASLGGGMGDMMDKLRSRFDPTKTSGKFNTESAALIDRPRDPSATTPPPPTPRAEAAANDPVSRFKADGAAMTERRPTEVTPDQPELVRAGTQLRHKPGNELTYEMQA